MENGFYMNIREVILDILLELEKTGEYSHLLVADVLQKYDYLDIKEKAFIKRVTEGTIEQRILIDYVLDQVSHVPVRKMKPLIRDLLRMSAYQILMMDGVPDAAVCNEAVKLAGKRKFKSLQGFVNGVLRNLSRRKGQLSYPDRKKDPVSYFSVRYSMPMWLAEYFLKLYTEETTERILQAFLQSIPVTLRLEEGITEEKKKELFAAWQEKGIKVKIHPYLPYAVMVEKIDGIRHLAGFKEGAFSVQDVSSMLLIEAAGLQPDWTIVDVCAAPGGKSLHAASKLHGTGRVYSFDLSEIKTARIEENRRRLKKENMIIAVQDAREVREDLRRKADAVIADVPCSGLGVIGKKQDIKYRINEQAITELTILQKEILQNAVAYIKPGGLLMYSTCTISTKENEEMVAWLCDTFDLMLEDMSPYLPESLPEDIRKKSAGGMLQLLPGVHLTDGFFLARLRRPNHDKHVTNKEKDEKADLKSLTLEELYGQMEIMGEKAFRARQLYEWMHKKLVRNYNEMSNLPGSLISKCQERFTYTGLEIVGIQESRLDGTKKFLFKLFDGNLVESILMRYKHGNSVCISSQVGCRMGCSFCASTLDGLIRNLMPSEMLDQIYAISLACGERISNVVVMGTGEPLDNYDNLLKFIRLLADENGLHISQRNITVSTCGLVPEMRKLAEERLQITLALSLHAATDEKRRQLMPIANRYSISELMDACMYYFEKTGRRITFEYSLIGGVNDTMEDARLLARLAKPINCHINLIPVNPIEERDYVQSTCTVIEAFKNKLEKFGTNVTIRRGLGADIDGACGQLRRRCLSFSGGCDKIFHI